MALTLLALCVLATAALAAALEGPNFHTNIKQSRSLLNGQQSEEELVLVRYVHLGRDGKLRTHTEYHNGYKKAGPALQAHINTAAAEVSVGERHQQVDSYAAATYQQQGHGYSPAVYHQQQQVDRITPAYHQEVQTYFTNTAEKPAYQQTAQSYYQKPTYQQTAQSYYQKPAYQQEVQISYQKPAFQQTVPVYHQEPVNIYVTPVETPVYQQEVQTYTQQAQPVREYLPTGPCASLESPQRVDEAWVTFKEQHGRTYESPEVEATKFATFSANWDYIKAHNARFQNGDETYCLGMNTFGDLHFTEFAELLNGFNETFLAETDESEGRNLPSGVSKAKPLKKHEVSGSALPESVDWREKGYVTRVKDQGACASCWSFSSTGALEGQLFKKNGKLVSLSEQNLIDCSTSHRNKGCKGGLMPRAFQYVADNNGIDSEDSYGYEARDAECRYSEAKKAGYDVGYVELTSGDEAALKDAVATVGPISVAIDASHIGAQFYKGGVITASACSSKKVDHAVLVVGYGSEGADMDYWLIKNSYGEAWGENGYLRLRRNFNNHCGVAKTAFYPVV